jgi:hypothetical protein
LIDPATPVITTASPLLHHIPGHDRGYDGGKKLNGRKR